MLKPLVPFAAIFAAILLGGSSSLASDPPLGGTTLGGSAVGDSALDEKEKSPNKSVKTYEVQVTVKGLH